MAVGQHIACHSTRKTPPQAIPPGPLPCHGPMANSQIQKSIIWICRPSSTMFEEPSRKIQRDCGKPLANDCSSCAAFESSSHFQQFHVLERIAKPAECTKCIIWSVNILLIVCCVGYNFCVTKLQNQVPQKHGPQCTMFINFHRFYPDPSRSTHGHGTPPEKGAGLVTGAGAAWTWGALPQDSRTCSWKSHRR